MLDSEVKLINQLNEAKAEIERLRAALKKIEDRTTDNVAKSIAGETLVDCEPRR
jgi:hypothetical protein